MAQKFSTRVTGLPSSFSGWLSVNPLIPLEAVPSQKASTSSLATPAEANAAEEASISRSSVPLSQCSRNWVHPIPIIATWSLMPWLAISRLL